MQAHVYPEQRMKAAEWAEAVAAGVFTIDQVWITRTDSCTRKQLTHRQR